MVANFAYVEPAGSVNDPISVIGSGQTQIIDYNGGTNATYIGLAAPGSFPQNLSFTGSISGTTLTVTAISAGTIVPGSTTITGSGVTANTVIVNQLSGAMGGIGTYTVSISQTASSTTITGVASYTPIWQIKLITYDGNSNPTSITFANGSGGFNNIWANRTTYAYS